MRYTYWCFLALPALSTALSVKVAASDEDWEHKKGNLDEFHPNSKDALLHKEDQAAWLATSGGKSKVARSKLAREQNTKFGSDPWLSSHVQAELAQARNHRRSKTKINENLKSALHKLDDALMSISETHQSPKTFKNSEVSRSSRRLRRAAKAEKNTGEGDVKMSKTLAALKGLEKMLGVVGKDDEVARKVAKVKEAAVNVTSALELMEEEEDGDEEHIEEALAMLEYAEDELEIIEGLQSSNREVVHHKNFDKFFYKGLHHSAMSKRSAEGSNPHNHIKRVLTPSELSWLEEEFSITKDEVEMVQALPEVDFHALVGQLRDENQEGFNIEGLVDVLHEVRHLVSFGVGAAASGVVKLGKPVYTKVATLASDGGEIAVDYVGPYVGPSLQQLADSIYNLQERLSKVAKEVGPQVVPTLQAVVEELRETVELTSKVVGNTVAAVGDEVSPIYKRVRQKAVEKPSFKELSGKAAAATDLVGDGLSTIGNIAGTTY